MIRSGGTTTFSLNTTPINIPIKSYKVGFLPMHMFFSFIIWPISTQSFKLMKADIAQMIDHLETIFSSLRAAFHLIPLKSYKAVSDFPIGHFDTTMTPTQKNSEIIKHLNNGKSVFSHIVYR